MDSIIANIIVIAVLICVVGAVVYYIYKAKKRGEHCIGCPYAKQCGGTCDGGCHSTDDKKKED